MGAHARLGAQAGNRVLAVDNIRDVLSHSVHLDGDLMRMGEGLLRQLAVRTRRN